MFIHTIDPVLLHLGPLQIRYYGLFYALGFLITYFFLRQAARKKIGGLQEKDLDSLLLSLVIGTIVGARLFEIIFYHPSYYFSSPLKMLAVWEGGLSFHGGLVGVFVAVFFFCRKKAVDFFSLADVIALPAVLALALGRIGNFINGELYGRVTTVPWAVQFPGAEGYRHPSQLYESFKNVLIFIILWFFKNKEHQPGFLFGLFLALYGTFRFVVEFVREPEIIVGFLTMGQLLSIPLIIIGASLLKLKK